jgi:hypothetical protein
MRRGGIVQTPGVRGLPKGVSKARFRATLARCEGEAKSLPTGGQSKSFAEALAKFSACLQAAGVDAKTGVAPTSAAGKAALTKCESILRGVIKAHPGAGGATTTHVSPIG